MKKIFVYLFTGILSSASVFSVTAADAPDLKYGLYIHFGMPTFIKPGEQGEIPAERFAPAALDVKAWARAAKESGMTFAVLTAKHQSGFCLWDSADYDYDITHSPVKTDLLADFITACNAEGILPGVHYSVPDALNEGAVRFGVPVPPPYFNLIKKHMTELQTKYPGLRVLVIDGSPRFNPAQWDELSRLVHRLNSQCVILDHNPGSQHLCAVASVIKGWMWRPQAEFVPATALFAAYNKAVAAGQPFLLNVGPAPSSRIPDDQLAVLKQMKELIAHPPESATAAPATSKPAAERLKQVKQLYDQGLITKEDYDKKVKEIMDSL